MKLEQLREIAKTISEYPLSASFPIVPVDAWDLLKLLNVVEAANNLLSKGADHPTFPMLDLGSAVCKLEAVE